MKENNSYYIDNTKVILIFLVVFGHIIELYMDSNVLLMGIYIFIYIFHMPLFIFISGHLSKNLNKGSKGLFKKLLVPYIFFNILWYSLVYLYMGEIYIPIIYPGWTLWFLLSLFFWRITLKFLIKIKYILPLSFVLGIVVGGVSNGDILSFSRTIVYLPFFLLGYSTNLDTINKVNKKIGFQIGILGMFIFILFAFYIAKNNVIDYRFLYGSYSFSELGMNNMQGATYRSILYLCSILLGLLVCTLIPNKKTFYTKIGKTTMYIYTFHIYLILIIFYFIPSWDINIVTNIIVIISPILMIYILSRQSFVKLYNMIFNPIYKIIKLD